MIFEQWEKLQPGDYEQKDGGATINTGYVQLLCVCVCVCVRRVPLPSDEHARMEENRQRSSCSLERLVRQNVLYNDLKYL